MLSIFKWSGSKRSQVDDIINNLPDNIESFYEPFVGSGIVTLTLLSKYSHKLADNCKIVCSDLNADLINLWKIVKDSPLYLEKKYELYWKQFNAMDIKDEDTCKLHRKQTYYNIRDWYNETKDPYMFFFLMRTCVNGLIRYNPKNGNFNASCHFSRPGMHPDKMKEILYDIHDLLIKYNVQFYNCSYSDILKEADNKSVVYLDPPYFESFGMYYGNFDFNEFNVNISKYPEQFRKVLISFDGVTIKEIDFSKYDRKQIYAGKSGFKKLHKIDDEVYDSLYISK